jgi:hypothetical protein
MLKFLPGAVTIATILLVNAIPAAVEADGYKTAVSAEVMRPVPKRMSFKVEFDGVPGPPEKMRAIFHEEIERRKFRIDPVSEAVMVVRWGGPFRENDDAARLRLKGKGGTQSRTELGFSITLGTPATVDDEATYSLGAAIMDGAGDIWKGKVILVTASKQKSHILRQMTRQLIDSVGLTVTSVEGS